MDLYNTIQNGGFGSTAPMQQTAGFNPYSGGMMSPPMGNIVPFGYVNYGIPNVQQQTGGPIFQPIPQQYFQQPQYQSPFGGDYNNPYATTFAAYRQQQQMMYPQQQYYGGYGYPSGAMMGYYGSGYNPNMYISPMYRQQQIQQQKSVTMLKYEIAAAVTGKQLNTQKLEEALETKYNPTSVYEKMSEEERRNLADWNSIIQMSQIANNPYIETLGQNVARMMREQSANYHRELDHHSLFQFLEEDLWKLQREFWIAENINRNQNRNLSGTYDSKEYNELLNLHNSSNPYINQLLNDSRYDNNQYDEELGMNIAFNAEKRRLEFKRNPLPDYISSEETQRRRHLWTEAILNGIYNKNNAAAAPMATGGDNSVQS